MLGHKTRIQQLNALQPIFEETLVRSIGEDALSWPEEQAREQILTKGAPIVWAFVATEEGIHTAYPKGWLSLGLRSQKTSVV